MKLSHVLAGAALLGAHVVYGQGSSKQELPLLSQPLQSPAVVADELQHFMQRFVPPLEVPSSPKAWEQKSDEIRTQELGVLYHGWPEEWVHSTPHFERVSVAEHKGYRIVKMRFEVVPGFWSSALLYEPEHMTGKMPAILDVNGHGPGGKAVEHKQKRCINQALRGIVALNLEWFSFGDLSAEGNNHSYGRLLDLAGANGEGLFYLEMRRGLDFLYDHPNVDRARIGVTGLSGGGWQTIMLSSLDPRVGPAVPVAGFATLTTAIEQPRYTGADPEQNGSDSRVRVDYAQFIAMRAPRPTLLIYNDMDDCCFRADIVKQGVYDDIKPFYALFGKPGDLQWYDNQDPGTHNYQRDSREASYRFFDAAFGLHVPDTEYAETDAEVQSAADLNVGLPADNLTILGLAQRFAAQIHHDAPVHLDAAAGDAQRRVLRQVARCEPVTVKQAWPIAATHENKVQSVGLRFEFSNGLSATGVLLRSVYTAPDAPVTLLMADAGMKTTVDDVANDISRGRRVLVLDPLFFGENIPGANSRSAGPFAQMLAALGQRPLGLEAAQVNAVVRWLATEHDHGSSSPGAILAKPDPAAQTVHMITTGPRAELVGLTAAALEPELFRTLAARKSIDSLAEVFKNPQAYDEAYEMFCLDLYRDFDINTLAALAAPVNVQLSASPAERIFWH
jgi:dienelactone hydrolase